MAAAEAVGVRCIGVERHAEYYDSALAVIPKLAALKVRMEREAPSLPLWE